MKVREIMDQSRFSILKHSLSSQPSRRDVLRALVGAGIGLGALRLSEPAASKKKRKKRKKRKKQPATATQQTSNCTPNCTDRACGSDGCGGSCGTCSANQVCQGGACCTPEPRSATCGGRCGKWTNNCGQPVTCATCPTGQQCLSNGSCAIVCTENSDCSSCGCSNPSVEGARHCISGPLQPFVPCTSTLDCPPGAHCQDIGAGGVCIALCT
jgi:hypothetical protein